MPDTTKTLTLADVREAHTTLLDIESEIKCGDYEAHLRGLDRLQTMSYKIAGYLGVALDEVKRLTTELAHEKYTHGQTIDARDRASKAADALAYALGTEEQLGEHTNCNDPWQNALELLAGREEENTRLREALRWALGEGPDPGAWPREVALPSCASDRREVNILRAYSDDDVAVHLAYPPPFGEPVHAWRFRRTCAARRVLAAFTLNKEGTNA